ncbi:RING finger protein 150-like [Ornithodoros turicata]|uniref:RING finger protein 150-like n=1 Tax=Ornithodoros turicata TaxID=34597 RepID=UPI0031398C6C
MIMRGHFVPATETFVAVVAVFCLAASSVVRADFTYAHDAEEYYTAIINLTYINPTTGQVVSDREELGKYSAGKVGSVSGVVVHVTSNNFTAHDACSPLDTANIPQEPWIALIQHGNCIESVKMRHAANTNASGAVVYNNNPGSRLVKMRHKVFQIISVFISREKGEEIATLVDNGTRVLMHVSVGSHRPFPYPNINRTSVLFVSISFIILMIISLAWLVFYYVQRFRYIHAKDLLARRLCSAAKKALDKIPVKTLKSGDKEAEGELECCAVCIEPFRLGEVVRLLPCKHIFHKSCVDPWLLEQRSCPMCKMDILKHYGLVYTGSQESVLNMEDVLHHQHRPIHHPLHGDAEVEIIHVPLHHPFATSPSRHPVALSREDFQRQVVLLDPDGNSGIHVDGELASLPIWEDSDGELYAPAQQTQSDCSSKEPLVVASQQMRQEQAP